MTCYPAYDMPRYMRGRRAKEQAEKLACEADKLKRWGESEMELSHLQSYKEAENYFGH